MSESEEYIFADLSVGQKASFEIKSNESLIRSFAAFSGDWNPLHTDSDYAQTTAFKQPVAHGMIIGAMFSKLIGMLLPGRHALYLSQTLDFHKPMLLGVSVLVEGIIEQKVEAFNIINVATTAYILPGRVKCVSGQALVKVLK